MEVNSLLPAYSCPYTEATESRPARGQYFGTNNIKELATGQANLLPAPDTQCELALIRHYDHLREVSIYP